MLSSAQCDMGLLCIVRPCTHRTRSETYSGHHSYLGETQTATSGIAQVGLVPEGECLPDLPLVSLHSIVLFPGQTLPMTVSRPPVIRAIKDLLEGV